MIPEAIFDDCGAVMRFGVLFSLAHEESLVEFVKENELPLFFGKNLLDPYFFFGDPGVDAVVSAHIVLEEYEVSNHFSVDDPYGKLVGMIGEEGCPTDFFSERLPMKPQLSKFGGDSFLSLMLFEVASD